jgi:hypothetical protein
MTDSQGVSLDETPRSPRKSTVNMEDPEVRLSALVTDLRCLYICTKLLQNVNNVSFPMIKYAKRHRPDHRHAMRF